MGFKGASIHTINDSGRMSIPSKIRDVLKSDYGDETLVLAIGRSFLVAYPVAEWAKFERHLEDNPPQNEREANLLRMLYASLEEVSIDKQGRILISPTLRSKGNLSGDCMIVGMNNRIEIWNKADWDAEMAKFSGEVTSSGAQFNQLLL